MARKFITLEAHCGNDYVNAHWSWNCINKYYITLLLRLGFPVMSLSVSPPVTPTWVRGNSQWGGNLEPLHPSELLLFKEYLKKGGGLVYYETGYNTNNEWYPGFLNSARTIEDLINSSCKRLTEPFNPFTGIYDDLSSVLGELYGIAAAHEYIGNLGDDGQVKAVINGQAFASCWANYLCGVERLEYAGTGPLGPDHLSHNWIDRYTNLFNETPFSWLCGLQCLISYRNVINSATNHLHLTEADQGQRNWKSKTPLERTTFIIDYLLENEELADLRVGTFLVSKALQFQKDASLGPIFPNFDNNSNWRHWSIPGQTTPRRPQNLVESRLIDEMKGTDTQLFGLWKEYTEAFFSYLKTVKEENENVEIFSDATSKKIVKQQYHGAEIKLTHEKIIDIADFLADKTTNWQINLDEWDDETHPVTRPPDFVKLTYESENEFYSLAEAWWIMLYALYLIASNDGLTELPDIMLKPVIGPCQPDICPRVNKEGLPEDSPVRINVWWQHDEYEGFVIKFKDVKKAVRGLFPQAKTSPIGPTYPSNQQVELPKVIWRWPLLDENENTVHANAAELLYVMAQMLVNWEANKTTPATVAFLPSHVLAKLFYEFCQDASIADPFGTDVNNQDNWFNLGQSWTLKPAVLNPEYR